MKLSFKIAFCLVLLSSIATGQAFSKLYFTQEHILLYENALLKMDSNYFGSLERKFFKSKTDALNYKSSPVAFPDENAQNITSLPKLLGKTFRVKSLLDLKGNISNSEYLKVKRFEDKIVFQLQDTLSKDSLFYLFNMDEIKSEFPFLVSNLNLRALTALLFRTVDEYNGEVSITHWYPQGITLTKYIHKGVTRYYLSLNAEGETPTVLMTGVNLIFTDKRQFNRPDASIDVKVNGDGSGYDYSAFMPLSQTEMQKFTAAPILKYRLYIHEAIPEEEDAILLRGYAMALLKAK